MTTIRTTQVTRLFSRPSGVSSGSALLQPHHQTILQLAHARGDQMIAGDQTANIPARPRSTGQSSPGAAQPGPCRRRRGPQQTRGSPAIREHGLGGTNSIGGRDNLGVSADGDGHARQLENPGVGKLKAPVLFHLTPGCHPASSMANLRSGMASKRYHLDVRPCGPDHDALGHINLDRQPGYILQGKRAPVPRSLQSSPRGAPR